jgi:hypothetical protein
MIPGGGPFGVPVRRVGAIRHRWMRFFAYKHLPSLKIPKLQENKFFVIAARFQAYNHPVEDLLHFQTNPIFSP